MSLLKMMIENLENDKHNIMYAVNNCSGLRCDMAGNGFTHLLYNVTHQKLW